MSARRVRHRPPAPGSCAGMWAEVDEPAWGSAAPATFFVALEQPGPWGNTAFTQSRLDPELGAELERRCAQAGGRALLIRSPHEHHLGRDESPGARRLLVSGGMTTGSPWLLEGEIDDPATVLDLPVDHLTGPNPAAALEAVPALRRSDSSALLVCTNAKRDACCAVLGRPVAHDAALARPGRVWECTHTGGHRFSATAVALPTGATLARLTTDLAVESVDAAARAHLAPGANAAAHLRGLAHLPPPAQAADAYVRTSIAETDVTALVTRVLATTHDGTDTEVLHRDGRRWILRSQKRFDEDSPRRNSCITAPVPAESWHVTVVTVGTAGAVGTVGDR